MITVFIILAILRLAQLGLVWFFAVNPSAQWAFIAFVILTVIMLVADAAVAVTVVVTEKSAKKYDENYA